ncbi:ebs-bah-phd domain-containing [Trichoderma arundinaceum]|uniref:Ebs-bah-phd domain-containing n=1 Tax=Trichoderma arundinaceum TaxID=490622 RepID=A0A395NLP6_TRIAR|nr:ebs-bah-phd domain-containing [Trichoderma arundinaceum]
MSSKPRKRSRPAPDGAVLEGAVADENRADCPFTVTVVSEPERTEREVIPKSKKRKQDKPEEDPSQKPQTQNAVFRPEGRFKTNQSMKLYYVVDPRKQWLDMTRYNSFVLNGIKYFTEDFVYVANEATMERQNSLPAGATKVAKKADYWVARILEVRAADEHHVYARVFWMYWPEELPLGTLDGKKQIAGRQPYHGQHELIASNHMDIINVVSVVMGVNVKHWIESNDDDIQESLYWRQAFNCRTSELSSVELVCKCRTPANPDKTLVGCSNKLCDEWMHYDCLLDDVLARVYDRLGTDTPHKSAKQAIKEEVKEDTKEEPKEGTKGDLPYRLLSPSVEGEDRKSPIVPTSEIKDQVLVKQRDDDSSKATETPTPAPPNVSDKSSKTALAKRGKRKKSSKKPWEGLFEATLKMDEGPTIWEITDLREDVEGGEKKWTEQAHCLLCDTVIE